jgi:hypothetical protein
MLNLAIINIVKFSRIIRMDMEKSLWGSTEIMAAMVGHSTLSDRGVESLKMLPAVGTAAV